MYILLVLLQLKSRKVLFNSSVVRQNVNFVLRGARDWPPDRAFSLMESHERANQEQL